MNDNSPESVAGAMGKLPVTWVTGCAETVGVAVLFVELGCCSPELWGSSCLVLGLITSGCLNGAAGTGEATT